jgi:hypothetical protein
MHGKYDETILKHMLQLLVHETGLSFRHYYEQLKLSKYESHSDIEVQGCSLYYRDGWDWRSELQL